MPSHFHEPPGASAYEQEKAFDELRATIQKKTELIAQYDSAVSNKSNINSWLDERQDYTPDPEEWQQPPADDLVGNAIYAVYAKGYAKREYGSSRSPSA